MDKTKILEFLSEVHEGSRVCLYGAGKRGVEVRNCIESHRKDIKIVGYIDSFKTGKLDGLKIHSKEDLKKVLLSYDLIIVTSSAWEDIVKYLKSNQIANYKVLKRDIFKGWGMSTEHNLPWEGGIGNEFFLQAHSEIKTKFNFSGHVIAEDLDSLLWRHWTISFMVRYITEFAGRSDLELVECGVANGMSAFFALRELKGLSDLGHIESFRMHLYDSWGPMRDKDLLSTEKSLIDEYIGLSLDRVKKNLSEFTDNILYYQGYIPESLSLTPSDLESIAYLHIDLNSANPTKAALEFFFPKIVRGGLSFLMIMVGILIMKQKKQLIIFLLINPVFSCPYQRPRPFTIDR